MTFRSTILLAAAAVFALACHRSPELVSGMTDTIRTGSPTTQRQTASTATIGTTQTTGTAAVSTTAQAKSSGAGPADTTSTRAR